jgi:diguanylate cyclase (GGDEF)-like protein
MSPIAPLPSGEDSPASSEPVRPRARSLTEALRYAVTDLDASAVGVTRAGGGPPKYFTRSALAAQFFEDVCTNGLQMLKAQTQTKGGVFGTNRVRADSTGPVKGRLIAVSLRSPQGVPLGTLVAVRLIEEAKFGAAESQKLLGLARDFAALLADERNLPTASARNMWPAQGTVSVPESPGTAANVPAESSSAARAVKSAPLEGVPAADTPPALPENARTSDAPQAAQPEKTRTADAPQAARVSDDRTAATSEAATPVSADKAAPSRQAPAAKPEPTEANDTVALLAWTEFEGQIRAQEADHSLPGCVLYGDIDQLHVLNKLAGFGIGDLAIAEVGAALQTADLPQGSCSCHLSGDRYTVYIPRTTLAQGRRIAEQLSKSVSGLSVTVHSMPTPLSISFGVALIPASEAGIGHALAAAEAACKTAKDRGRGRVEVYQDADQSIVRRNDDVLVADRLRQALEAGRLEVFAQPIVRLNGTQSTANYELLVRLIGEAGTHLSPAWFMSAATRYRMLVELDRAVVGQVLAKLEGQRTLLARKNLRFSVNLSGPSIGDPDFLEWIASRIGGVGVPGEWLQFEITETAAVANVAQTQAMIRRLQARGVQFALDDFGTGVSSFAYLKYFDVKMLKLDGSFVRDLMSNSRSESLVRGIAQLGRGMNIETVAECVETYEVRDRLTELGIDCAQGFLFGRPKPIDGVLANELGLVPPVLTAPTSAGTEPTAAPVAAAIWDDR